MKRVLLLLSLICSALLLGQGIHNAKAGFSPRKFRSFYHFLDQSSKLSLSPEVEKILSQPFFYLGKGRQCFAFQSKDNKYVLKLPRTDLYKLPLWMRTLSKGSQKERIREHQTKKRNWLVNSFTLAHQELKEETGTIAVHFGNLLSKKSLTLVDALGMTHHLPLESTFFALQAKHPSWDEAFLKNLKEGNRDRNKQLLKALSELIAKRAKKGIVNRDSNFLGNYGFDGTQAIEIDIGSFYKPSHVPSHNIFETSICDSLNPVESWLGTVDEEMKQYLLHLKAELLNTPSH